MESRTLRGWVNLIPNERGRLIITKYIGLGFKKLGKSVGLDDEMCKGVLDLAWKEEYPSFMEAIKSNIDLKAVEPQCVDDLVSLVSHVNEYIEVDNEIDFSGSILNNLKFEEDEK